MFDKLEANLKRFKELENSLADPAVINDANLYQKYAKEYGESGEMARCYEDYLSVQKQIDDLENLLKQKQDKDLEEMIRLELTDLLKRKEELTVQLDELVNPKPKEKNRNMIIEIRAGTGGEEASLFAGDLYRMYTKYADSMGWKVELMSLAESETGGLKEVVFSVMGDGAEKRLKWESGAHRVQRVPTTEQSGRIHTSAATVAVLFEPEEVDIVINPADLRIDVYRSSGPGGQSVNTTDSAVRITHIPTGTVVACQDERSQQKNRAKAMRVLRARINDKIQQENFEKTSKDRKQQVGSGDRSEKIRTYNFPDRRITDHRIGFTTHRLDNVMDGELDELTSALIKAEQDGVLA